MTTLMKVTIFLTMTKNYDLTLPQYKTKCWKCSFLSSSVFSLCSTKKSGKLSESPGVWKMKKITGIE